MPKGVYERKPLTPEHKANLLAALIGHPRSQVGSLSPHWKGDVVGYDTAHYRIRKALADQPCAHADESCGGRLEVAFNHITPEEFVRVDPKNGPYSVRPRDYQRLCQAHHTELDATERGRDAP